MENKLRQIREQAARVAAQREEQEAAYAAERKAAGAVLDAAIDVARPALRALGSSIILEEITRWHAGNTYTGTERTHHAERGVRIAGDGPEKEDPRDNAGGYSGRDLYLLEEGRLAEVQWGGTWSKWQGAESRLTSALRIYANAEEALGEGWDLDEAIAGLSDALDRQANGKAPERASKARERAERLAALAKLLK